MDKSGCWYDVIIGDCIAGMKTLDNGSVHTCVTSPPYFGLRSYDESAVQIDPRLPEKTRLWVLSELRKRGVHAKR